MTFLLQFTETASAIYTPQGQVIVPEGQVGLIREKEDKELVITFPQAEVPLGKTRLQPRQKKFNVPYMLRILSNTHGKYGSEHDAEFNIKVPNIVYPSIAFNHTEEDQKAFVMEMGRHALELFLHEGYPDYPPLVEIFSELRRSVVMGQSNGWLVIRFRDPTSSIYYHKEFANIQDEETYGRNVDEYRQQLTERLEVLVRTLFFISDAIEFRKQQFAHMMGTEHAWRSFDDFVKERRQSNA